MAGRAVPLTDNAGAMIGDPEEVPFPLTDLALARRLERAEGTANAAFVDARAAARPEVGAAWTEIAGVHAMFDGADSPLTQTFGLGLFEDVGDAELERIEGFFRSRGAPVFHETCPMLPAPLLARLGERGYRPVEFSAVLVRPTRPGTGGAASGIGVRRIESTEVDLWARTAGEGWSSESPELADFIEAFGQLIARARGVHCFLAELDGRPIATGALCLHGDVALLAGASTIPAGRRQGAQLALLDARLQFAAERGVPLAMMVAQPGSGSQRNAERQGFRIAYTRTKWRMHDTGR